LEVQDQCKLEQVEHHQQVVVLVHKACQLVLFLQLSQLVKAVLVEVQVEVLRLQMQHLVAVKAETQ
jgi:hypothetical protein